MAAGSSWCPPEEPPNPLGLYAEPWECQGKEMGGWGGVPLLAVGHRPLLAQLMPQQTTWRWQSLGPLSRSLLLVTLVPIFWLFWSLSLSRLSPAPSYLQPKDLSLSPGPSLLPLVPSPGPSCLHLLFSLVLVLLSCYSLLPAQFVSISFHLSQSSNPICSIFWWCFAPFLLLLVPSPTGPISQSCLSPTPGLIHFSFLALLVSWYYLPPLLLLLIPTSLSPLAPLLRHLVPSPCPTWSLPSPALRGSRGSFGADPGGFSAAFWGRSLSKCSPSSSSPDAPSWYHDFGPALS